MIEYTLRLTTIGKYDCIKKKKKHRYLQLMYTILLQEYKLILLFLDFNNTYIHK